MATLIVTDRGGGTSEIDAQIGVSVMQAIRDSGQDEIAALCGGSCSCATCHVYVEPAWMQAVGPASTDEADLLDSSEHRRPNSRLSCQIELTDALNSLHVTIAPED